MSVFQFAVLLLGVAAVVDLVKPGRVAGIIVDILAVVVLLMAFVPSLR